MSKSSSSKKTASSAPAVTDRAPARRGATTSPRDSSVKQLGRVLVINGPNLNLLGTREPEIYGATTLKEIENGLRQQGNARSLEMEFFQSNHEGALVDRIHAAMQEKQNYILINPGAYTHTSIALRDALSSVKIPFLEIHLSNIHSREAFRHHSYLSDIAQGVICGLGIQGYRLALQFVIETLQQSG